MNERQVEKEFKKIYKKIVKLIGHDKSTNGEELNTTGKRLFGNKFKGIYPVDVMPLPKKNSYYIINTDIKNGDGIHWVALYRGFGNTIYVYDSFARSTSYILKIMTSKLKKWKLKLIEADRTDREQKGNTSEMCGQLTISWISVIEKFGIRNALKI